MRAKNQSHRSKKGASSRRGTEPRLLLPAVTDREAADARLKALIDDWIVPRLVHEFLREHAVGQEAPGRQETQVSSSPNEGRFRVLQQCVGSNTN